MFGNAKTLLTWGWEVKISHCFRVGNQVANRLANTGVSIMLRVTVFQSPTFGIMDILYADSMGDV